MSSTLASFAKAQYISLETFRGTGAGVRTPVWFAATSLDDPDPKLYVYSASDAGKVKRIRGRRAIRIAPCAAAGRVTGDWVDARAQIVGPEECRHAMALIDRKYWPWKQILDLFARLRPGRHRVVIAIRPV